MNITDHSRTIRLYDGASRTWLAAEKKPKVSSPVSASATERMAAARP